MFVRRLFALVFMLLVTAAPAFAQQPDPNVLILWPPPTFVLSGSFTIYGTANVPGMVGYYFELRPLIDSATPAGDTVPWTPVSLPDRNPVVDGVLGVWDTTQIPDGLYEIRLTVITSSGQPIYSRVSPLRVMNTPSPFATQPALNIIAPPGAQPQPTQFIPNATSPAAAPQSPMAQANIDANVRAGDSTSYAPIGALRTGQTAPIIGRSTRSTWWLIQLPNGGQGWIAPSTITVTGDTSGVPYVAPPELTATPPELTATPAPVATVTPMSSPAPSGPLPDAAISAVRIDIGDCAVFAQWCPFTILVTVVNNSAVPLPSVSVACNFTPINNYFSTTLSGLPAFGQTDVEIPVRKLTIPGFTTGQMTITANCAVDVNNLVAESDESNNYKSLSKDVES